MTARPLRRSTLRTVAAVVVCLSLGTACGLLVGVDDLHFAPDASAPSDGAADARPQKDAGAADEAAADAPRDAGDAGCKTPRVCGGKCIDLATDPHHCGTCGHDCLGGGCSDAACEPAVLVEGGSPAGLAIDSTNLYWTNAVVGGTVQTMRLGGGPAMTIAKKLDVPRGITVYDGGVFFAVVGDGGPGQGAVCEVSVSGGSVTTLSPAQNAPFAIVVRDPEVYFTSYGGGAVSGSLNRIPIIGGVPTATLATAVAATGLAGSAASTSLYWTDFGAGMVKSVHLSSGMVSTLATKRTSPFAVAVDGNSVYFTEFFDGGAVERVSLEGGAIATLAATQATPASLTVYDGDVYFTDYASGAVMELAKDGGAPVTLASGQHHPGALAVDATRIYWVNGGEAIMALAK